jgi:hypothetical protein
MYARWASFAVGMGLVLAPLVLGYDDVSAILQDIALGMLICIATLAALEWPAARFALAAPGLWLVWTGRASSNPFAAVVEIGAGGALAVLALFPSGRFLPRIPQVRRPADRDPARARA